VTGVGPKAALAILSATTPERFALAIMSQDERALTMAQGVGKKLAQRIILELKDKIGSLQDAGGITMPVGAAPEAGNALALAQAALSELGYSQSEIASVLRGIDTAQMTTSEIVRQALRAMVVR
ncbi:MAG: Holliday junction branch migration protein RuvA, partial [Oscillospiraceae bacterium]|nr:Holliday junction branch migration protein RuvA [Oscillospiraceae bacterium]